MDLDRNRRWIALATTALLATLAIGGCKATKAPVLESGPNAEITHDGLVRVRWSRYKYVWLKPNADFGRYSRVMMDPVSVGYKRPPRETQGRRSPNQGGFALSDSQMADLKRYFSEAFEKALGKLDNFAMADSVGPQTLRVEAAIIDLVVNVPTRPSGGERVFTTSAAQMTLVMELRDSITGEILARVADRRDTQSGSGAVSDLTYSTPATNAGGVRLLFKRWAQILATRLDAIHNAPPVGVPAVD
ncbi:MAG: DUF3313 family protein [Deltaproteobacteria bacterium]|nr:DUF3313 family protein [Deltaproteobacteria bacterium]MBW2399991.1 DUF3313 family protein [Deltaproteobacteria bacterium]MBW2665984.1 DUF3313 family protein [Deltaproteobacteria bacterium]